MHSFHRDEDEYAVTTRRGKIIQEKWIITTLGGNRNSISDQQEVD